MCLFTFAIARDLIIENGDWQDSPWLGLVSGEVGHGELDDDEHCASHLDRQFEASHLQRPNEQRRDRTGDAASKYLPRRCGRWLVD